MLHKSPGGAEHCVAGSGGSASISAAHPGRGGGGGDGMGTSAKAFGWGAFAALHISTCPSCNSCTPNARSKASQPRSSPRGPKLSFSPAHLGRLCGQARIVPLPSGADSACASMVRLTINFHLRRMGRAWQGFQALSAGKWLQVRIQCLPCNYSQGASKARCSK